MDKNELIEALWKNIKKWERINVKICNWESEFEKWEDVSNEDAYLELCGLQQEVGYKIHKLLINTKYLPLVVSDKLKERLDFFKISMQQSITEDDIKKEIQKLLDLDYMQKEITERFHKIEPIYSTVTLDVRVNQLYKQMIDCYIYGFFKAGCVLCRAILEFILKEMINKEGHGQFLAGRRKSAKDPSLIKIAAEKRLIQKDVKKLCYAIQDIADNILHEGKEVVDEHCLESIKKLQNFIKIIYKIPDTKIEEVQI